MPRDIIPGEVFQVRVYSNGPGSVMIREHSERVPKETPPEDGQATAPDTEKGKKEPETVEKNFDEARAFARFSEILSGQGGRNPMPEEGVFQCTLRENGVVVNDKKITTPDEKSTPESRAAAQNAPTGAGAAEGVPGAETKSTPANVAPASPAEADQAKEAK